MSGATISDMSPVEQVQINLTETNGDLTLFPRKRSRRDLDVSAEPQVRCGTSPLSSPTLPPLTPIRSRFALRVMSMSFQDPAAHWRSVYRFLPGEREYERQRELDAPHFSAIVHRDQVETAGVLEDAQDGRSTVNDNDQQPETPEVDTRKLRNRTSKLQPWERRRPRRVLSWTATALSPSLLANHGQD